MPSTSAPDLHGAAVTPPAAAPLDNPLYYLENAETLVRWVLERHGDLLTADEIRKLEAFLHLSLGPRGLLVRMVMRTREVFRLDSLRYGELPGTTAQLVDDLVASEWVIRDPALTLADLFALFRKGEIFAAFQPLFAQRGIGKSARKTDMAAALAAEFGDAASPASAWLGAQHTEVVGLASMALFDRIRLMFFGNLRQDWSEFVVTELGYQNYEPVPLGHDSRAFSHRAEVDAYLELHHLGQRLDEGDPLDGLWQQMPTVALDNPWLDHRRRRLVYRFGHAAEREGETELALAAYRCAWTEEARIRYFRVRERAGAETGFVEELAACHGDSATETEQLLLSRILRRADKAHPLARSPKPTPAWPTDRLALPPAALPVELCAAEYLSTPESPCFYVENGLFNSLLGLLLWPAIYAPVPGAFFHPFQAGPADLFREDFVPRRRDLIDEGLAALADDSYRARIRHHWASRRGINCPLVHWGLLDDELLELALACIGVTDLEVIFRRLLGDLRRHRSGFPDLIRFWPAERRYELVEVKGPGDRLQDHQTLWLRYFRRHGIAARVCHVSWTEGEATGSEPA